MKTQQHCLSWSGYGLLGVVSLLLTLVSAPLQADAQFGTRVEARFGESPYFFSQSDWRETRGNRWAYLRSGEKQVATRVVVNDPDQPVAILVTAEAEVVGKGKRLFIRLLVDGKPMKPSDVVFAIGGQDNRRAAQSFEFTARLDKGMHVIEAQWLVDDGGVGRIRQVGLLARQGDQELDPRRREFIIATPPSAKSIETQSSSWQDVPGLEGTINASNGECLVATVSAEAYSGSQAPLWLRVLVDGNEADPGAVPFLKGRMEGTRSMDFGDCAIGAGSTDVVVQWRTDKGGNAWLGDRTLTVSTYDKDNLGEARSILSSANDAVEVPSNYTTVPALAATPALNENSEVTAVFSVVFDDAPESPIYARMRVNGSVVTDSEVLLADSKTQPGSHSFVFTRKDVPRGSSRARNGVTIEWRADKSSRSEQNKASARSLHVLTQEQPVPDYAVAMPLSGLFDTASVEPMHGRRNVLAILWDPDRPNHPAPSTNQITQALDASTESVSDYFEEISDDRFELNLVDVLGPYAADLPAQNYWDNSLPGDHQDKWTEAISKAAADFDFAAYDRDGDGYVHPWHELAIIIVVPQTDAGGFTRHIWQGSGETPTTFDGVHIETIVEWYSSDPQLDFMIAAHELGHLIFTLPDLYPKNLTAGAAANYSVRPGRLSLMESTPNSQTQHLDAVYKLALGWVNPLQYLDDGIAELQDVKLGNEVVVLPRRGPTNGAEYLIVENRQEANNNLHYDRGIGDSGLVVWHVIESGNDATIAPACTSNTQWNAATNNDPSRQGVRLLRPSVSYSNVNALWDSTDYDFDPFGLSCPNSGVTHNALRWADGNNAWSIVNFDSNGSTMGFEVQAP